MSGFEQINQTLWINKDPEAQLFYKFDWSEWLATGDAIDTAVYSVSARINDPDPIVKVSDGIQGNTTYVELKNGQEGKTYTVSVKVTTTDGLVDSRFFKVKVEPRSA